MTRTIISSRLKLTIESWFKLENQTRTWDRSLESAQEKGFELPKSDSQGLELMIQQYEFIIEGKMSIGLI